MSDQIVVQQLKAAAQDALSRGFKIIACLPHDKAPYPKYSPHACNSGTSIPEVALKPWEDDTEANYGISCGMSNVTVIDADHGLNSFEEFIAWRDKNNFPPTLTARSGNRDGYRVHMFYTGAVNTTKFDIDGVTGELKGKGGYVVGAGSLHPSGFPYEYILDIDMVPLPDGIAAMGTEKKPLEFKPVAQGGKLIPAGSRWIHMQSIAGKLRNVGMSEEGIEAALWDFLKTNCEDGENYPPEKVSAMAKAAVTKFDATEATPIVFFGGGEKIDTNITELPLAAIDGDWIGDLAHEVSDGTFIPASFARAQIKTILGASLDGMVGFPSYKDTHMKHWTMLISSHPEAGKGESWKRTGEAALATYMNKTSIGQPKSGWFSSGEHMVKKLAEGYSDSRVLVYFDEMRVLFDKGSASNSSLFGKMTELFDRNDSSAGSLSHAGGEFTNVSLSLTGGFTQSSFEGAVAGKGAAGDGFLSRCVIAYSGGKDHVGDWTEMDTAKINAITQKMQERWGGIYTDFSKEKQRFIPTENEDAKALRLEFSKELGAKRNELNENGESDVISRLEAHFRRDLLLRTIFSEHPGVITLDSVERSIAWAKHEMYLREELWPVDRGNLVERMEQCMRRALRKHEHLTKRKIQDSCNVHRAGSGGMDTFNRAWTGMLKGGGLVVVGRTHKGTEKFGLPEGE